MDKRRVVRANDLSGSDWLRHSISIWSGVGRSAEESRLDHAALFPVALADRIIRCFTISADRIVLDPFAGSGSTLLAAAALGRTGVGVDISEAYVTLARQRLESVGDSGTPGHVVHYGDARNLGSFVAPGTVGLCFTSPPYWDNLDRRRTADGRDRIGYREAPGSLGNRQSYEDFLEGLSEVFSGVLTALVPGKFCVVNVMDLRKQSEFYPLHADLAQVMCRQGWVWDDLILWDRRNEYNHLRPLGYPRRFRINNVHEYLLIFRKPPDSPADTPGEP